MSLHELILEPLTQIITKLLIPLEHSCSSSSIQNKLILRGECFGKLQFQEFQGRGRSIIHDFVSKFHVLYSTTKYTDNNANYYWYFYPRPTIQKKCPHCRNTVVFKKYDENSLIDTLFDTYPKTDKNDT